MSVYMSKLFGRSNSSFLLRSGNALEAKAVRLRKDMYLINAAVGRPRLAAQDELIRPLKTAGPARFTTKVGFLNPSSAESRTPEVRNQMLQRCFVDLVTGDAKTRHQAAARFDDMVGKNDAVGDEEQPLLPNRQIYNRRVNVKNLRDATFLLGHSQYKKFYSRSYSSNPINVSPGMFSSQSHPILQSSVFQHWFKNWQHLRKHKLTASTIGMAVGFWPRGRAKLWLEKLGTIEPFSGNLATCWSNMKEEEALERYKLITGNTVSYPEFQVYGKNNPEDNWLAASPDGAVDIFYYGLPTYGVLEIKCPFFGGDMSNAYPWKRVPLHYIPQAQGLMEILDRDWMDMYCWTVNGSSLFRINRDVEYWGLLKIALDDFWWKHVQPAKEMCNRSVITNPLIELRSLRPAPKHELCYHIVCESKQIVDNSKLLMREIHGKLQN